MLEILPIILFVSRVYSYDILPIIPTLMKHLELYCYKTEAEKTPSAATEDGCRKAHPNHVMLLKY